jgi:PAS domain S-box-containing protein
MRRYHRVADPSRDEGNPPQHAEHFRELFEDASDLVYTIDLAGNFTSINRTGETLTGYSREALIGSHIGRVVAPESLAAVLRMMDHMAKGVSPATYELELIAKDGRRIPIEVGARLIARNGQAVGAHGIGRDISLRKQADQKTHQRAAHLEALNAIIAAADAAPDLPRLLTVAIDQILKALGLGWAGSGRENTTSSAAFLLKSVGPSWRPHSMLARRPPLSAWRTGRGSLKMGRPRWRSGGFTLVFGRPSPYPYLPKVVVSARSPWPRLTLGRGRGKRRPWPPQ